MLDITKMRLFPSYSKSIFIPMNSDKKYNVIFYPENRDFVSAYPRLQIRRQFVKKVTILPSRVPVLRNSMDRLVQYKQVKLIPVSGDSGGENVFIDCGQFLDVLDSAYGKSSYKRSMITPKVIDYLNQCNTYSGNSSVLLYYVDFSKEVDPNIIMRRLFPIFEMARTNDGVFPFSVVCLAVDAPDGLKYISIHNENIKPGLGFSRMSSVLKRLIPKPDQATDSDVPEQESEPTQDQNKPVENEKPKEVPPALSSIFRTIEKWT